MADRVSKKVVLSTFARFCQAFGLQPATKTASGYVGFGLDEYNGYKIVEFKNSYAEYEPLGSHRYSAREFVDVLNFAIHLAYWLEHYAPSGARRFSSTNPRRRRGAGRGAGRYVATEMRAMRRGSAHVRSRRQAIAVGLAEARRAGVKVSRRNPTVTTFAANPRKVARLLSKRALEIRYVHATDGDRYVHKFKPGVSIQFLSDGSARFYRPDGRPLWRNFKD